MKMGDLRSKNWPKIIPQWRN